MRDPPEHISRLRIVDRPLLLVVEGSNDLSFLTRLANSLARESPELFDVAKLIRQGRIVAIPVGGNPLPWTWRLAPLRCREFHLFDRERPPEEELRIEAARRVNRRRGCRAFLTRYRSLENYLSPAAITAANGGTISFGQDDSVPAILAQYWHEAVHGASSWQGLDAKGKAKREQRAQKWLNTIAVEQMTTELLSASDPEGDLRHWLSTIRQMATSRRSKIFWVTGA